MAAVSPVALDRNFPEPLLGGVVRWMPEFDFHWIKDQPPGELNELEDHDLVYELNRRAFPVMATNNHKMLDDQRVLVAIEQTPHGCRNRRRGRRRGLRRRPRVRRNPRSVSSSMGMAWWYSSSPAIWMTF